MGDMGELGVGFDVRARARASASASESDAGVRVVRCGVVFASDARTPTPCALAPTSKGEHAVLTMDVLGDVDARLRARAREDGDEEESEACVRHFGCVLAGAHFAKKADRGRKRKAPPGSKRAPPNGDGDGDGKVNANGTRDDAWRERCPPPARFALGHYRDPMHFGLNAWARSSDEELVFETPFGQQTYSPVEYARLWGRSAHAACALADEHGAWENDKKSKTAAIRTRAWLDACLEEAKTVGLPVWATLVGGEHVEVREECSRAIAERDEDVCGYVVGGLFAGEREDARGKCVEASLRHIKSENKPRYLSGQATVEDIVDNIERGIDVFDASWASATAARGRAFSFPIDASDAYELEDASSRAMTGADAYSINVWSTAYKTDFVPFLGRDRCHCPACVHHTRAYTHHLLQAHEMTAHVLLEAHNLYHLCRFFAAARRAIRRDEWPAFAAFHRAHARRARQ